METQREIKFRVFDKKFKIMSKPFYSVLVIAQDQRHGLKELQEDLENWGLMQYTGLQDKNGVEIYEGDIIRGVNTKEILRIKFHNYCFMFDTGYLHRPLYDSMTESYEVIGNIYENPELIKG